MSIQFAENYSSLTSEKLDVKEVGGQGGDEQGYVIYTHILWKIPAGRKVPTLFMRSRVASCICHLNLQIFVHYMILCGILVPALLVSMVNKENYFRLTTFVANELI